MHILMLTDEELYPKVGGSAFEQWEFAKRTVDAGHEITIVAPRTDGAPRWEQSDGVEIRRPVRGRASESISESFTGMFWRVLYNIQLFVFLVRWCLADGVDVVYSATYHTHPVAKATGALTGRPVANYVQWIPRNRTSENAGLATSLVHLSERIVHRYCLGTVIFCKLSEVGEQLKQEAVNDPSVVVLNPTMNTDRVRSVATNGAGAGNVDFEFDLQPDDVLLSFVGRFVGVKDIPRLLEVVAELPENYKLVLVGDGPAREAVAKTIDYLDMADRVHLTGKLDHPEALSVIAESDGLLLTSRNEVDPTVVYEALGLNTTVFTTPVGTVSETSHPNLEVQEASRFAEEIESRSLDDTSAELDQGVLQQYSIENFVDSILDTLWHVQK